MMGVSLVITKWDLIQYNLITSGTYNIQFCQIKVSNIRDSQVFVLLV